MIKPKVHPFLLFVVHSGNSDLRVLITVCIIQIGDICFVFTWRFYHVYRQNVGQPQLISFGPLGSHVMLPPTHVMSQDLNKSLGRHVKTITKVLRGDLWTNEFQTPALGSKVWSQGEMTDLTWQTNLQDRQYQALCMLGKTNKRTLGFMTIVMSVMSVGLSDTRWNFVFATN